MAGRTDASERIQLEELSAKLREATWAALESRSALARSLDELRGEVERRLMLPSLGAAEVGRVMARARMMLDAWQGLTTAASARLR